MTHTPGPWHVGPHYTCDVESREGRVCECRPFGSDRADANARLIAAAPDLLEALKSLRNEVIGAIGIGVSDSIGHTNAKCLGERCPASI